MGVLQKKKYLRGDNFAVFLGMFSHYSGPPAYLSLNPSCTRVGVVMTPRVFFVTLLRVDQY